MRLDTCRIFREVWIRPLCTLGMAVGSILLAHTTAVAQEKVVIAPGPDLPAPVTAKDPKIPTEELELLLKPMRVTELASEKNAWMELVQEKVRDIAQREIAVRQQNAQIAVKKEVVDAVSDAREAIEEAGKSPAETPETVADVAQLAVEQADAAVQEAVAEAGATEVAVDVKKASEAGEAGLSKAVEAVEEKIEEDKEVKVATLEELKDLRTERAALVERLKIVLDELERKGGAADEERYYIKAVSGINVDVSDQEAAQAAVMGWLTSEEGGLRIAWNIIKFILITIAAWFVSRIVGGLVERLLRVNHALTTLMRDFLSVTIRRIVLGIGLILALAEMEVDTAPLLAMIGAAGFVVAFALQGSLSNFASGIMILYFKPFDVGDWVEVAGVSGSVASLNLVSTTIATGDNKKVIVPNNSIWGDVTTNATGTEQRRVDMVFGIGYGDDMAKAQGILERIIAEHPSVLSEPEPVVRVHELADSSVNFIVRPWVRTEDYWPTYWDLTRKVKEEFDAAGVSIPFPQRDVHVYHETAER
jgi:small conductance mechanosensitive channel